MQLINAWTVSIALTIIIASIIKIATTKKFVSMFNTGGMPSGHSAFSSTLAVNAFYQFGFNPEFFIAGGFALLFIYDSFSMRSRIDFNFKKLSGKHLLRIGHSIKQSVVGILIGVSSTVIMWWLWNLYFLP